MHSPQKRTASPPQKKKAFQWESYHIVALLSMFSFGVILFFSASLLASKLLITQFIVVCCLGGLLIPMKLYYHYLGWGKIASFMVNIFGIGPVLAALLLGINHTFSSDNQVVQHAVVSVEVVQDYEPYFLFELENNAMAEFAEFRTFNVYEETKHYADATAIRYTIGKGLLGYDVVKETTVLP